MKAKQLLLLCAWGFILPAVYAGEASTTYKFKLIKNLGQQPANVLYSGEMRGGAVYLERNTLTYVFYDDEDLERLGKYFHDNEYVQTKSNESPQLRGHAYKVHLKNANPHARLSEAGKFTEYYNYFLGQDESKWAGNVPLFGEVVYKEIYPGIALSVHGSDMEPEYDFVVKAGGDVSKIVLNLEGTNGLQIENGNLKIKTSVGDIIEQRPMAFQFIGGKKINVPCGFRLRRNNVMFSFPEGYDNRYELIIDPVIVATTYSGTTYRAYAHTATYDDAGNIYSAGKAFSVNVNGSGAGYPVTTGAFQTTHAGGYQDICISKYNPNGSALLWATYIGGSLQEQPHSLVVNGAQQLYIYGTSNSANYPVSATGYQRTNPTDGFGNHLTDIVVTKLNASGSALIGSTYVGGNTEQDGVNYSTVLRYYGDYYKGEIVIDSVGNAYVASYCRSANFPVTAGAIQTTYGGGYQDGVIFKLNSDMSSLLWSTFYGGPGEDACYGLKLDANGNLFVTGAVSSNILTNTTGTIHSSYIGGLFDAFVSHISSNGQSVLKSTYFGSVNEEQAYLLNLDKYGNVYIFGATPNSAIQPTPGAYQGAMNRSYIAKLMPALDSVVFISVFNEVAPTALMIDDCDYIYAVGHGGLNTSIGNLSGFPTTSDALQTGSGGFYMLTLEPNATALKFGSYYGPQDSHVDGGTCRFDRRGIIYHALCTDKTTLYTPTWAYRRNKTSNDFDNTVFKIDFQGARVAADALGTIIGSNDTSKVLTSCSLPLAVQFINNSANATQYSWYFGNGDSSASQQPLYTFTGSGSYHVMLVAKDSNTCNKADTSFVTVDLNNGVVLNTSSTGTLCNSSLGSATVNVVSGTAPFIYTWSNGDSTATISNLLSGNYSVTVHAWGNCYATATVTVSSSNGVTIAASSSPTTCGNNNGAASANVNTGASPFEYLWSNGDTLALLNNLPPNTYLVTVTDANGCSATASAIVGALSVNALNIYSDKDVMCSGDSALICISSAGFLSFHWNTGQTDSCIYTKLAGNYYLTATDNNSCTVASGHIPITVLALPPVSISVNGDTLTGYDAVTYQWYLNGVEIAGVTTGVYIAQASGDYTLAVTDSNGCRAVSTKVTVMKTGIEQVDVESDLMLFPNPSDGNVELQITDNELKRPLFITVFDVTGRKVFERPVISKITLINLQLFAKGVYVLKVDRENDTVYKKVIKR